MFQRNSRLHFASNPQTWGGVKKQHQFAEGRVWMRNKIMLRAQKVKDQQIWGKSPALSAKRTWPSLTQDKETQEEDSQQGGQGPADTGHGENAGETKVQFLRGHQVKPPPHLHWDSWFWIAVCNMRNVTEEQKPRDSTPVPQSVLQG